jgi:replication-associated recombination protein RarA
MDERRYYEPARAGLEIQIGEKLAALREANRLARKGSGDHK